MRVKYCLLVLILASPGQLLAQQPRSPITLMIGPVEYVKAPNPFPIDLGDAITAVDSTRARNLAPRNWGVANLRACRAVAISDTSGWGRIEGVQLPSGFSRDPSFRSYHGGLRWTSGDLELVVENGWWGVEYDSSGHLISCRAEVKSGTYVVSETQTSDGFEFRAFPLDPAWRPSTRIVARAPTEEDLRVLWTSFTVMSSPACRYMTGGPVYNPQHRRASERCVPKHNREDRPAKSAI